MNCRRSFFFPDRCRPFCQIRWVMFFFFFLLIYYFLLSPGVCSEYTCTRVASYLYGARPEFRPTDLSLPSTTNTTPSGTSRDVFIIFIFYPRVHTQETLIFGSISLWPKTYARAFADVAPVISIGASYGAGEYKYTKQKKVASHLLLFRRSPNDVVTATRCRDRP